MPHAGALVVLAEYGKAGTLVEIAGTMLRAPERRRLGTAMLRDAIERAHLCAGFDPFVAYFPPERRGDVEDAAGTRGVWAEPMAGASPGARAAGFLRHLLSERPYKDAVAVLPAFPHAPRDAILKAARALRDPPHMAIGVAPGGAMGLVAVRGEPPEGFDGALDGPIPAAALQAACKARHEEPALLELPDPIDSEEALARLAFDTRADLAARALSPDDVPLHTLELFDALGLLPALRADGSVELRRAGPPRR